MDKTSTQSSSSISFHHSRQQKLLHNNGKNELYRSINSDSYAKFTYLVLTEAHDKATRSDSWLRESSNLIAISFDDANANNLNSVAIIVDKSWTQSVNSEIVCPFLSKILLDYSENPKERTCYNIRFVINDNDILNLMIDKLKELSNKSNDNHIDSFINRRSDEVSIKSYDNDRKKSNTDEIKVAPLSMDTMTATSDKVKPTEIKGPSYSMDTMSLKKDKVEPAEIKRPSHLKDTTTLTNDKVTSEAIKKPSYSMNTTTLTKNKVTSEAVKRSSLLLDNSTFTKDKVTPDEVHADTHFSIDSNIYEILPSSSIGGKILMTMESINYESAELFEVENHVLYEQYAIQKRYVLALFEQYSDSPNLPVEKILYYATNAEGVRRIITSGFKREYTGSDTGRKFECFMILCIT